MLSSRLRRPGVDTRIVAVDLQEMSPIDGVIALQGDITSYATVQAVIDACGGELAHIVICDGAPDVTGLHDLDEYVQFQLLLSALNISTLLLVSGGTFVAKVFRGENMDLLIAKLEVFFDNVYVAKPRASRNSSIECFIIGKGFKTAAAPVLSSEFCLLNSLNKSTCPFVACGDLSAWDADRNYTLDSSTVLPPVQPPINPAYRQAMEEQSQWKFA